MLSLRVVTEIPKAAGIPHFVPPHLCRTGSLSGGPGVVPGGAGGAGEEGGVGAAGMGGLTCPGTADPSESSLKGLSVPRAKQSHLYMG